MRLALRLPLAPSGRTRRRRCRFRSGFVTEGEHCRRIIVNESQIDRTSLTRGINGSLGGRVIVAGVEIGHIALCVQSDG
jgi:hypothetical protein